MHFDPTDFNELTRRATDVMLRTSDIPRLLRLRLGPDHELAKAAEEMLARLENFVRELRSYHGVPESPKRNSTGS